MTDDAKGGWCGRTLTGMRSLSLGGIRYHWCCWNVWSERESLPWRPFDWVWIPILHFLPLLPQTLCWVSHMKFKRKVKLENWKMIKTVPRHLVINTTCNACLCCCSCFLIAFNTFFAMEVFPPLVKSSFELPIWGQIWIQYSEFHSHPPSTFSSARAFFSGGPRLKAVWGGGGPGGLPLSASQYLPILRNGCKYDFRQSPSPTFICVCKSGRSSQMF